MKEEFDVTIRPAGEGHVCQLSFPAALSRALVARGYNRAKLVVTDDGIIVKPYQATVPPRNNVKTVDLPTWEES